MKLTWIFLPFFASIVFTQTNVYTLCEGNYGTPNATLWSFNEVGVDFQGPIHWDPNTNPLGDIGQSLTIANEKLYIVMNNSHSVEIMNLTGIPSYETTIYVSGAGPRYLEVVGDLGYLTCWNISGILILDLNSNTIIDTINVSGMPESMVYHDGKLYTSIALNEDWSVANRVLAIDLHNEPIVTDTFEVIDGPGAMVLFDNNLLVASTYYDDAWQTYTGISRINLNSGQVSVRDHGQSGVFNIDLTVFNNSVYRTYNGGMAPLTDSLTINANGQIGQLSNVYSMATHGEYIYFGLTDYSAPDNVVILNSNGDLIANHQVGAIPGSFAFHSLSTSVISPPNQYPDQISFFRNYPNPFNRTTVLSFNIDRYSDVNLSIFTINGTLLTNLFNGCLTTGSKQIFWDASRITSGTYLCVLNVDGEIAVTKMCLVK